MPCATTPAGCWPTAGPRRCTYGPDGQRRGEGLRVFVSCFAPAPRMLVFGAIDFAAAVARIGSFLGYRVTVCDARPVFATRKRFPDADEVIVDWPHRYLQAQVDAGALDRRTVICVLTHDPKFDVPVLAAGAAATGGVRRSDGIARDARGPAGSAAAGGADRRRADAVGVARSDSTSGREPRRKRRSRSPRRSSPGAGTAAGGRCRRRSVRSTGHRSPTPSCADRGAHRAVDRSASASRRQAGAGICERLFPSVDVRKYDAPAAPVRHATPTPRSPRAQALLVPLVDTRARRGPATHRAAGDRDGEAARSHFRTDHRAQRLPRSVGGRRRHREFGRSHRRAFGWRVHPALLHPGRWRRVPRDASRKPPRGEPQDGLRLGGRPHRRDAAALGAVPRRADHRGVQRDGPRLQRRRQPRVRRGHSGTAADAVRQHAWTRIPTGAQGWVPPRRRVRRRRPVPWRRLRLPRRERPVQGQRGHDLPALRHPPVPWQQRQGGVRRDDPGGDAADRVARRHRAT